MSIEETLDRLATNVAMIAGAIATLAEAVNGSYKGAAIYANNALDGPEATKAPKAERKKRQPAEKPQPEAQATSSSGTEDLFGEDASPAPSAAGTASTKTDTPTAPSEEEDLYGEAPKAAAAVKETAKETKAKALTVDDVRARLVDLQTKAGTSAAAKDMIKKYSKNQTTVISSVPEDKFVAMVAEIDAALAKK